MYVNTKIIWIRALGAEIIDFVDDGIFRRFRLPKPPKSAALYWKPRIQISRNTGFRSQKDFKFSKSIISAPRARIWFKICVRH